jgi:hypothetical protein
VIDQQEREENQDLQVVEERRDEHAPALAGEGGIEQFEDQRDGSDHAADHAGKDGEVQVSPADDRTTGVVTGVTLRSRFGALRQMISQRGIQAAMMPMAQPSWSARCRRGQYAAVSSR